MRAFGLTRSILSETNFHLNVTALTKIVGKGKRTIYDGDIHTKYHDISVVEFPGRMGLSDKRIVRPGFFKRLEDLADAAVAIIEKDIERKKDLPARKEDVDVAYDSNPTTVFGPRGYTNHTGSYIQRPLTKTEMKKLITRVDRKLRPKFYEKKSSSKD